MWRQLIAVVLFVMVTGCGGRKYVPVSGQVTLDGKPLAFIAVLFQPKGSKENPNPGRGSAAVTDGEGKFTLQVDSRQPGAVTGAHYVRLMTVIKRDDSRSPWSDEIIPAKYRGDEGLNFDVPPAGTDQANFEMSSR